MLHTSLAMALSLALPIMPADHHDRPGTPTVRVEANATENCPEQGKLYYRPVVFGTQQVAEYRGVPFGSPAPRENCRIAKAGEPGPLYYRPVPFGTQQVVEYRGDLFSTPRVRAWNDSRAARLAKRDGAKRATAAGAGQD